MTREETIKVLAVLASAWPNREVTDETIKAYQAAWSDLPYRAVNGAAQTWLREGKFFPAPAELRTLIVGPRRPPVEDWGLGPCDICGQPAGYRERDWKRCWAHVDAVVEDRAAPPALAVVRKAAR